MLLTTLGLLHADHFRVMNTEIRGSLESLYCDTLLSPYASADCGGESPEVECSCCVKCCDNESGGCVEYPDRGCEKVEFQSRLFGYIVSCECDGLTFSCEADEQATCESCNEDGSICGISLVYGFSDVQITHLRREYHNTYKYTKGRNETITWREIPDFSCDVGINGQECNACTIHRCRDGFPGRHIDCTNVIDEVDAIYDTCQGYEPGGLFEWISWWDLESWTGCLPVFYRWSQVIYFDPT